MAPDLSPRLVPFSSNTYMFCGWTPQILKCEFNNLIYFSLIIITYVLHVCVYTCVHKTKRTCGFQRTPCGSQFSPSAMCVCDQIQLNRHGGKCLYPLSHHAGPGRQIQNVTLATLPWTVCAHLGTSGFWGFLFGNPTPLFSGTFFPANLLTLVSEPALKPSTQHHTSKVNSDEETFGTQMYLQ